MTEDVQEGSAIVPRVRLAQGTYLKVLSRNEDGTWLARWHDHDRISPHHDHLFRLQVDEQPNASGQTMGIFKAELVAEDQEQNEGEAGPSVDA